MVIHIFYIVLLSVVSSVGTLHIIRPKDSAFKATIEPFVFGLLIVSAGALGWLLFAEAE